MVKKEIIVIGYSGHAYVVIDSIKSVDDVVIGYCDNEQKKLNPYKLEYLGTENESILLNKNWIIAIGDNRTRKIIFEQYGHVGTNVQVQHKTAVLGNAVVVGKGTFIAANVSINALVNIGVCTVINTGAIIEHECTIGDFSHIAPGAVLAGDVTVGKQSFIGANSVIKQGVTIGDNVIVGAGSVILEDILDGVTVVGNPGRILK